MTGPERRQNFLLTATMTLTLTYNAETQTYPRYCHTQICMKLYQNQSKN